VITKTWQSARGAGTKNETRGNWMTGRITATLAGRLST
jgi:hypothetical protein